MTERTPPVGRQHKRRLEGGLGIDPALSPPFVTMHDNSGDARACRAVGRRIDSARRTLLLGAAASIDRHCRTPGVHAGGELGYALAHAYGAALDAPGELVVAVIGDGEAETAALAGSWHSHHFLNPATDGAVLPVLHLNGWKIANPTLLARLPEGTLQSLLRGYGHEPWFVTGDKPAAVHAALARALDEIADRHAEIGDAARRGSVATDVRWPMLVLRTPKGWTGPERVDGQAVEGHFRSHQVPLGHDLGAERLVEALGRWLESYDPGTLFTADGAPLDALAPLRPAGARRMSANPRTDGSTVRSLALPPLEPHAIDVGALDGEDAMLGATGVAGRRLRDVVDANTDRFLLFGPDEVASNRLSAVFEVTGRRWLLERGEGDVHLDPDGRVFEILSESLCQGWLEGYLLTGRHGLFTSYEAFIHVVDSMFNQHAKWLEASARVPWRRALPSLNYLLSSHVWRQDHNGFSHQDPGFLDLVANKRADVVRIYLPPDANSLLATLEHCLGGRHRVNVVDLMALQSPGMHPHGASDRRYDALLPPGVPVIFAFHGYPSLIHRLCHRRANHADLHVHGFAEEGTTTTPFDMAVVNGIDRFHLAIDAIDRQPDAGEAGLVAARERFERRLVEHRRHIREHGDELPEIRDWTFARSRAAP